MKYGTPTIIFIAYLFLLPLKILSFHPDSLRKKINSAPNDSARIEILYKSLGSVTSSEQGDSLVEQILNYRRSNNCYIRSFCYLKAGAFYAQRESPQKALNLLITALKIADSCSDKRATMLIRYRLAYVNKINDQFKVSINNSHLSLAIARQLHDSAVMADNYTLLGNIYKSEYLVDSALYYHFAALAIRERLKDATSIALTYNNIGLAYKNKKDFKQALYYLRKSLDLKIKIKDKTIGSAYNNISIVFKHMGQFDSAVIYSRKVLTEAIKYKSGRSFREALAAMSEAYDAKGDIVKALHYYKRLRAAEDSLKQELITKEYKELQSKYESDKKDADLRQKENNLRLAEAQNARKNSFIFFSSVAFIMALIAVVVIFRSYRQSKRTAKELSQKNRIIEEKNKEITDSINYARNIQQSLLTSETIFKENLPDYFVLFKPRDIVSGDFYWARKQGNDFLMMCADCTGHGVPGAFMSLLGISYLEEISTAGKKMPGEILNILRDKFIKNFTLTNNKDGMDASLIKLNGRHLEMASANNPVWIIRNKTNTVLTPDKFPIGKHHGQIVPFNTQSFQLQANDLVIMFTDGYADQFGGPKNKKFKYKKLENLILENSHLGCNEIYTVLEQEFENWKGQNEQIDDVLIIGVRI